MHYEKPRRLGYCAASVAVKLGGFYIKVQRMFLQSLKKKKEEEEERPYQSVLAFNSVQFTASLFKNVTQMAIKVSDQLRSPRRSHNAFINIAEIHNILCRRA